MQKYFREPGNSLSHLIGAILSVFALIILLWKAYQINGSMLTYIAYTIFGISLILLYSASSLYHGVKASERVIFFLRKFDHAMIYVLIAGTYAPFCLISLKGPLGYSLFTVISILAICGILFKLVWFHCPRWLSTFFYIAMGWMAIFVVKPLFQYLDVSGITFLFVGGILYTIGGFIYGLQPKWLEFKFAGHHEIFHIFILFGSLFHFITIYFYVM